MIAVESMRRVHLLCDGGHVGRGACFAATAQEHSAVFSRDWLTTRRLNAH